MLISCQRKNFIPLLGFLVPYIWFFVSFFSVKKYVIFDVRKALVVKCRDADRCRKASSQLLSFFANLAVFFRAILHVEL